MLKDTLNKGISTPIAIGIVLILVIIVGGFTWWQYGEMWREISELPEIEIPEREDEIADWKIYEASKTGLLIKYPPGCEIDKKEKLIEGEIGILESEIGCSDEESYLHSGFRIIRANLITEDLRKIEKLEGKELLEEITSLFKETYLKEILEIKDFTEAEIKINDNLFTKFCGTHEEEGKSLQFCSIVGSIEGDLVEIDCVSERKECGGTFNKMLSSIKFIEKEGIAFLGVTYRSVYVFFDEEKEKIGIPKELYYGALVFDKRLGEELGLSYVKEAPEGFFPGSPAEIAGLKARDIILEINDEKVTKLDEILDKYKPGDIVNLKILREGEEESIELELGEYSGF